MSKVKKTFSIAFGTGICGLEILFDPAAMEFVVGTSYYSPTAKKFAPVLPGARILSLNGDSTKNLKSMEEIQNMFKHAGKRDKIVVFDAKLTEEGLEHLKKFGSHPEFEVLSGGDENKLQDNEYEHRLERRPLGFTIAATSRGNVEVVQVDSVHEEDLKLGSVLVSVNGTFITDEASAIKQLLECKMPCKLRLAMPDKNIYQKDEESIKVPFTLANVIGEPEDQIVIDVQWCGEAEEKNEPFSMPIRMQAQLCELRAKIAAVAQLKYSAVNLVGKGKLLKDDNLSMAQLGFSKGGKNNTIRVVVSLSKQNKVEPERKTDSVAAMQVIGAFLMQVDPALMSYLWKDIDHENKKLLHITELDRLLARFIGVYERANYIKPNIEWKHGSVRFNTKENLGLVIEGNEVIMCHPGSQAEKQGILPGWKVVGAEYVEKMSGRKIKFPVDHKSCLKSLKRAKTECANNGFSVLCLVPVGERYDTQIVMKNFAINKLGLNDGSQTLYLRHFNQLPALFANGAVRVEYPSKPETDIVSAGNAEDPGAIVRKDAADKPVLDDLTKKAGVQKGWRVLSIGNKLLSQAPYKEVITELAKLQRPFAPPYIITYAPPL